jgi:4-alpha-glucanotransferase
MSHDEAVIALAVLAGLLVRWRDAAGANRTVGIDALRAALKALGLSADAAADLSDSEARLRERSTAIPPLQIVRPGEDVRVPTGRSARLIFADGRCKPLRLRPASRGQSVFHAPREPGYYRVDASDVELRLAVAPAQCRRIRDANGGSRLAGVAVQIYSLRGGTSGAFGDFAALGSFAKRAGRQGLDAILVSPTHALVGTGFTRFSPYSPSTRLFLNPLFADATLEGAPAEKDANHEELIDWSAAARKKVDLLQAAFSNFRQRRDQSAFDQFCRSGGERLYAHALFETLDVKFRRDGICGFGNWPRGFESPTSPGAAAFARSSGEELEFQLFQQWLADRSLAAAQASARRTMAIGLIADIAVGVNPEGSDAWSAPSELLRGLHVGAPPDIFNTHGQDWGLTSFSPHALPDSGYRSFIAMLRANMRHAGGVRLDHAMGLRRLWVIPAGASPSEGVYLRYPQRELFSLLALESVLRRTIVIGEDLGTVPDGFRDDLVVAGVAGMQVLWFERDRIGRFIAPGKWRRDAAAMTTTHDLPTVAGWWSGHDIEWRKRTGDLRASEETERAERAADRALLWSAFRRARCARGNEPTPGQTDALVEAALAYIGKSRCALAIAPAEDIASERDQPNLPGTTDEHPNWRRRMRKGDIFRDRAVRARLKALLATRGTK